MDDSIILKSLSIGGYKSFGELQRFPKFSKINLLIGQNNSGKSNVLKFIHEVISTLNASKKYSVQPLDAHQPKSYPMQYGFCLNPNNTDEIDNFILSLATKNTNEPSYKTAFSALKKALDRKASHDKTNEIWFEYDHHHNLIGNG